METGDRLDPPDGVMRCRWLGVAGLEVTLDGYTLLVDPFFTRPPRRALLTAARVPPDDALAARHAPRADAILVTHPHYDHLMDAPGIARRTGAAVFGTPNTTALLGLHGIYPPQAVTIRAGERLSLGPFSVDVLPARHTPVPLARLFNGPLPARLRLPLRLCDYRMDAAFSFRIAGRLYAGRIQAGERSIMAGGWPERAGQPISVSTLFLNPYLPPPLLELALRQANPRRVIFVHWDDFTRPLDLPLQPMLLTRAQGLPPGLLPLRRMPIESFARAARAILPEAEIVVPRLFEQFIIAG